jgi:hypothetical protein
MSTDQAEEISAAAGRIRTRLRGNIADIGRDLIAVKMQMLHGQFGVWIKAEFGMSTRTAENYMNAARFLADKCETLSYLPPLVIYALASPSAVAGVVAEVVAAAEAGALQKPADIKSKLAMAADEAAKAEIEAEKNAGQIKKERKAKMRREAELRASKRLGRKNSRPARRKSIGRRRWPLTSWSPALGRSERARPWTC